MSRQTSVRATALEREASWAKAATTNVGNVARQNELLRDARLSELSTSIRRKAVVQRRGANAPPPRPNAASEAKFDSLTSPPPLHRARQSASGTWR